MIDQTEQAIKYIIDQYEQSKNPDALFSVAQYLQTIQPNSDIECVASQVSAELKRLVESKSQPVSIRKEALAALETTWNDDSGVLAWCATRYLNQ